MPNEETNRPADQAGSSFFHQSWPIVGGTMLVQIRTSRVLLADEYVEIGKVLGELERLAEMLADQSEAATDADA